MVSGGGLPPLVAALLLFVIVTAQLSSCTPCFRVALGYLHHEVIYLWGFGYDVKTRLPISWVYGCRKDARCV